MEEYKQTATLYTSQHLMILPLLKRRCSRAYLDDCIVAVRRSRFEEDFPSSVACIYVESRLPYAQIQKLF